MVRDNYDFSGEVLQERFIRIGSNWVLNQTVNALDLGTLSHRSESASTTPLSNGDYVYPTPYQAFFSTGSSYEFDLTYHTTYSTRKLVGTSASSQPFANIRIWGSALSTHLPGTPQSIISRVEDKVNGIIAASDWNVGQTVGEAPETARFILETFATIVKAVKAARRLDAIGIAKALSVSVTKKPANNPAVLWLQYKYAWQPLLQDIHNATVFMANGLREQPLFVASYHESEAGPLPALRPGWTGTVDGQLKWGCEVSIAFGIRNKTAYNLNRLGLLNPAALAWELLPLSFVFDWFIPIGNFLDSLSQGIGLEFHSGYRTTYANTDLDVNFRPSYTGSNWSGKQFRVTRHIKSSFRTLYLGFPKPVPVWDMQINRDKVVSMLALAKVMTSRR